MHWKTGFLIVLILVGRSHPAFADTPTGKRPMAFEDLMAFKRIGEPVPSPDGKWVVFEAVDVNLEENTKRNHLWIVPSVGGESRRLNPGSDHDESRPRFSPDGRRLVFTAKAGDVPQLWMAAFDPAAGALAGPAHPVTALSTGAGGEIWSPDGKNIVFVSSVYPNAPDDAANKARDEALGKSKVKAQLFTRLFYRHWNAFTEFKRGHLFVVSADADPSRPGDQTAATPRDLTPGDHDVPPFSLGGQDMYALSPDGRELAYTSNIDEVEATSTNNDIFTVPVAGGEPTKISTSPGSDSTPLYSPDGKWIAWRSQARAGYESDKFSLLIYDRQTGQCRDATPTFDRWVDSIVWSPDSSAVFFTAEDQEQSPIYMLPLSGASAAEPAVFTPHVYASDLAFSPDGQKLFFSRTTIASPSTIASVNVGGRTTDPRASGEAVVEVTHLNDALLSQLDLPPLETFYFTGAEGARVEGLLLKPPGFDAGKKYPLKFLIHGGPEGAWGDGWSYRWNPELFAATGSYVVVMINPHGSTGYGQAFTDGVNGDWGGKPYEDLMERVGLRRAKLSVRRQES